MLKLIIKEKGRVLNLQGMLPVKTPVAVRMSPKDLSGIVSFLNANGVGN